MPLTRREVEALEAYARTGGQKQAAHELGVSVQTLKNHLSGAYAELGATNMIEALRKLGWLALPGTVARPCGRVMYCGRSEGHRGHHGGWRAFVIDPGHVDDGD
jgi:DNA-binding CsgD family transcriptional regulator